MSKEKEIIGLLNKEMDELVDDYAKRRIADLEAKLAESEKEIKLANKLLNELLFSYEKLKDNNEQLKQQLAEKEGKIETLKQRIDSIVKIYSDDFVSKDTELKELRHKVKQHNQDKISFAVEKLEKVKDELKTFEFNYNGSIDCCEDDIFIIFDNQIKLLKEGE